MNKIGIRCMRYHIFNGLILLIHSSVITSVYLTVTALNSFIYFFHMVRCCSSRLGLNRDGSRYWLSMTWSILDDHDGLELYKLVFNSIWAIFILAYRNVRLFPLLCLFPPFNLERFNLCLFLRRMCHSLLNTTFSVEY